MTSEVRGRKEREREREREREAGEREKKKSEKQQFHFSYSGRGRAIVAFISRICRVLKSLSRLGTNRKYNILSERTPCLLRADRTLYINHTYAAVRQNSHVTVSVITRINGVTRIFA
jgi:hypothetical protein